MIRLQHVPGVILYDAVDFYARVVKEHDWKYENKDHDHIGILQVNIKAPSFFSDWASRLLSNIIQGICINIVSFI